MNSIEQLDENVMVVETLRLPKSSFFPGIDFNYQKFINIINRFSKFVSRKEAENNYKLKQIIPYSVLFFNKHVVVYKRSVSGVEKRLFGNLSIGFGGHITESDIKSGNAILNASIREITEEVKIEGSYSTEIVGILNDDSNDVGKVHLGIIFKVKLESKVLHVKEKAIEDLSLVDISYLKNNFHIFESWSQFCIDNIESILS